MSKHCHHAHPFFTPPIFHHIHPIQVISRLLAGIKNPFLLLGNAWVGHQRSWVQWLYDGLASISVSLPNALTPLDLERQINRYVFLFQYPLGLSEPLTVNKWHACLHHLSVSPLSASRGADAITLENQQQNNPSKTLFMLIQTRMAHAAPSPCAE